MEFKEFKVEDLWAVDDWVYGKDKKWRTQFDYPVKGSLPVISGQTINNGVKYYTIDTYTSDEVFEDCLTITTRGEKSGKVFYHAGKFLLANNILVMKMPKYSKNVMLYLGTVLEKAHKDSNYSTYPTKDSLKTKIISLPVTPSGEIDFDYMEQYIEKIEKQYIEKIALMLKASGLDNYQLTEEEKAVLKEEKEKKEFKIEDLFEYKTGDVDLQKTDLTETGEWVVTAGTTNYGLLGKTTKTAKIISKNTITIDMFGCAFYRNFDYKMVTHARVFALIPKIKCSERVGLFLTGSLAYLKKLFSYQNMCSFSKIKDLTIQLPVTPSGEIDFDYIEKYISAIIKTKIKNVVLEINKKLELYKQTQN